MKIACCQIEPRIGDKGANLKVIEAAVREAAGNGATLIVLPELRLRTDNQKITVAARAIAERKTVGDLS